MFGKCVIQLMVVVLIAASGPEVRGPPTSISRTHPDPLIRQQALETLQQLR